MTYGEDVQRRWLRGMLEAGVIAILGASPAYGYEIAGRFEDSGFERPKGGTLYPILSRLESDGLIEPSWVEGESGPSRKVYRLTADGKLAADAIAENWQQFESRITSLIGHTNRSTK